MSDQINQRCESGSGDSTPETSREDAEKLSEELRDRVRKLERWVWGAGAVISAAITIIGLAMAADAKEVNYGSNDTAKSEIVLQLQSY